MSMITELIERLRESADGTELDMECSLALDGECNKLLREAADVIEELSTKLQAANMERSSQYYNGGWIPVSERLPEEEETVIASTEYRVYPETRYTKGYGWEWAYEAGADYWESLEGVMAWMPLPESYKAESEDKE